MRLLVAGVGNIFLTDDGFGPEVARRLIAAQSLAAQAGDADGSDEDVRVVDYGIRGMHLAYDLLDGYDALVIVDAVPEAGPRRIARGSAGDLVVLEIGADDLQESGWDAHGMNPVAVLGSLESLGGSLPPTYLVGCIPADLSEGIGLSAALEPVVDEAVAVVGRLVRDIVAGRPVGTSGPVRR